MTDDSPRELGDLRAALDALRAEAQRLDVRLHALETGEDAGAVPPVVGPVSTPSPAPPPGLPVAEATSPPPVRPRPPGLPPGRQRRPRQPSEFEQAIGAFFTQGNPLNKLGAALFIFGAAILFKYAVDNEWIGPTGRVGLGLLSGAGLFAISEYYQRKDWRRFASGLAFAGLAMLFISTFFGQQQYEIIPAPVAFGMYVVFTSASVAQSLRYTAMGLAMWGLLGAYLTPLLASTGEGQFVFLASYLLVVNTGVFAVAYHRNWQPLKWMAFLLTQPYLFAWVVSYVNNPHGTQWLEFHWLLPYLGAFFLYFAAIPTWRSLFRREPIDLFGQALTVISGIVHFSYAVWLLYDSHRAWLGVIAIVVTAIYVVITSLVVRQPSVDAKGLRVFTGTAAGFLLLATPFLVTGSAITLVWCAETVFLAWACTRDRFSFLSLHVVVMIGIILLRLTVYDDLFMPRWPEAGQAYIPFTRLHSYPPLAAALTFGLVARFLNRVPSLRVPLPLVMGLAAVVLVTALNGEAYRAARYWLVPDAHRAVTAAVRGGLLITTVSALWFAASRALSREQLPWGALLGLMVVLGLWSADAILWLSGYRSMTRVLDTPGGISWLHMATLMMVPLIPMLVALSRSAPERAGGLSRTQWQAVCGGAAVIVAMFLLRREIFAITHIPPLADFFPDGARRASYRMLLSLSFGLLAFGIYLSAVLGNIRPRLYGAYALYIFTGFKVIVIDYEGTNQLFRGFSAVLLGIILMLSHYFAERQRMRHES